VGDRYPDSYFAAAVHGSGLHVKISAARQESSPWTRRPFALSARAEQIMDRYKLKEDS